MKGFIEVTKIVHRHFSDIILIPLSDIKEVKRVAGYQCWIVRNDNTIIKVEESYNKVKELIKQAQ